jgi:hypothetical protein
MGKANGGAKRDNPYELPSAPERHGRVPHATGIVTRSFQSSYEDWPALGAGLFFPPDTPSSAVVAIDLSRSGKLSPKRLAGSRY